MNEAHKNILAEVYEIEIKCVKLSISLIELLEKSDKQQSKLDRVEHLHDEYWKQQDKQTPNNTLKELIDKTKKILDND